MPACPSCGHENSASAKFCEECGAPLAEAPAAAVQEERKVVSVLFCDLVGFTAASEAADPEDVRARIRPYHQRLRQEIERYGGTVEKFVGDAVMAVFGAPVAHEDDAERAVRAGLRILEAIAELNEADPALSLQVRIGIDTGEAVVALGARPEQGEGIVTGDVVNTASRLQGAAPVDGIAVSEQTYRQTERVFDYEELEPVRVKGKTEPLALYRPLAARARFGSDVTRTHTAPLVGRELEKTLVVGTFERSVQQRSCQLVTIVGEPGVGKSRLCAELFGYIEERPELVRWRQGRCLPYGEGIAFWALGEIVKAECGILESDSPDEAEAKLERAVPADDPDRIWLVARLAPLVGAPAEPASQEESFTAWRRFLEALAAEGPTVLVFEDLHWADDALLSFLEHLADWSQGVPLLVLCTARPELQEAHPSWAAGLRNATTINLAPLTDEETARLIGSLLERAVLPAETQRALLERAGGNPLYAEEFVRLLADRGLLAGGLDGSPGAGLGAGADRRAAGHALAGAQEPAPGRRRGRQGVLGGGAGGDGRPRARRGRAGAARAVAQGARAPLAYLGDAGRGRVRLLAPAGQGRLLRPDPARRPRRPPPHRRGLARASGGRAGRGPGRRARLPLPERARARRAPPAKPSRRRSWRRTRSATWPWPASARFRSTSSVPRRAWPGRSRSPPPATPSARRCSSAGRRRRSSRAGSRRHEPRSRRRSPSTAGRTRASPPGGC